MHHYTGSLRKQVQETMENRQLAAQNKYWVFPAQIALAFVQVMENIAATYSNKKAKKPRSFS